ncbi:MAG: phosphoribosylanthranilate isomerase [Gammaproteobacteria bacterium]|nr:phosphoribosylanthranilate isomerase [Gammaproteobacteria bacterium]
MRVRVKVCGIMSSDIAIQAVQAGADALGLMFYEPSKRHLTLDQALGICEKVGPFVAKVGVMVNPDKEYVKAVLNRVSLTHLQFHGEESAGFCGSFGLPYIKGVRVSDDVDLLKYESAYSDASGILLDTYVDNLHGGTGKTFDWRRANYGGRKPLILAGGLNPANVIEAIKTAAPYGVDVSSGVEVEGVKNLGKITAFCRNALVH